MLIRSTRLTDFPVLSLHLGSRIARLVASEPAADFLARLIDGNS